MSESSGAWVALAERGSLLAIRAMAGFHGPFGRLASRALLAPLPGVAR